MLDRQAREWPNDREPGRPYTVGAGYEGGILIVSLGM
jgi:hypothetical protein